MTTVAIVGDLMDRSKLTAAFPGLTFARDAAGCVDASTVIVDLARHAGEIADVRAVAPTARIICFGPHVDVDRAEQARSDGADVVLARSQFFRDPAAAIAER